MMVRPSFIILGAMKAATSTLHAQLAAQAGIAMSQPKEPNYFSNDENYALGPQWYATHFRHARPGDLIGETSTHYAKLPTFPQTLQRLQRDLPDARFIYVMRQPIDRLVSQYIHEWTEGEIREPLAEAVGRFPRLVDYSRYAMQLRPWLDAFGWQRVLPVFFDRLRIAPHDELARVCRFIGYDGNPGWQDALARENTSRERSRRSAVREALLRIPLLRRAFRLCVPHRWRERLKDTWRIRERPELPRDLKRDLAVVLDADLAILGEWLGVELDCRNFVTATSAGPLEWKAAAIDTSRCVGRTAV
jgi:hypothetical protein